MSTLFPLFVGKVSLHLRALSAAGLDLSGLVERPTPTAVHNRELDEAGEEPRRPDASVLGKRSPLNRHQFAELCLRDE